MGETFIWTWKSATRCTCELERIADKNFKYCTIVRPDLQPLAPEQLVSDTTAQHQISVKSLVETVTIKFTRLAS